MSQSYGRRDYRRNKSSSETVTGLMLLIGLGAYVHEFNITKAPYYAVVVGLIVFVLIVVVEVLKRLFNFHTYSSDNEKSGLQYEHYVAKKLSHMGYESVRLTEKYDLGVDIIANKDGVNWGIQVKYSNGIVSANAVRQAVRALNHYGCDKSMVITNASFSYPAIMLALSNECEVVNGFI
jgi:HJR/Mrr/RecB family endonuclease